MKYETSMALNFFAAKHAEVSTVGEQVVVRIGDPMGWPHGATFFFDDLDEARRVFNMALSGLEMLHRDRLGVANYG